MPTFDELDKLPTKDLRARAFRVARHGLDIGFFWRLVEYAPVAEDVLSLSATVEDAIASGEDEVEDALRLVYLDYLMKHDTNEK